MTLIHFSSLSRSYIYKHISIIDISLLSLSLSLIYVYSNLFHSAIMFQFYFCILNLKNFMYAIPTDASYTNCNIDLEFFPRLFPLTFSFSYTFPQTESQCLYFSPSENVFTHTLSTHIDIYKKYKTSFLITNHRLFHFSHHLFIHFFKKYLLLHRTNRDFSQRLIIHFFKNHQMYIKKNLFQLKIKN